MADITFDQNMQDALNSFETDLFEATLSFINNSKDGITNKISETVRENTRNYREYLAENISDSKIGQIISEHFDKIEGEESIHFKKITDSLQKITGSIIRLTAKKSTTELESVFATLTNEFIRNQNPLDIHILTNQATASQVQSYARDCFLYTPKIGDALREVKEAAKGILDNFSTELMEEYKEVLKNNLDLYRGQILEIIEEQVKNQEAARREEANQDNEIEMPAPKRKTVSANEAKFIAPSVKRFGIEFEETADGVTVKTAQTASMPLYEDNNGHYFTEDYSIEFMDLKDMGLTVVIGDKVIRQTNDSCYFGTRSNPDKIKLTLDFLEYKVSYANVEQTDLIKKGIVLDIIAKNYPDYYAYLSDEAIFASLKADIEQADKGNEELYKDDYEILRINPNNKAAFIDKVHTLGFAIEERADGVYAIDDNGKDHKLQYNSGYAYFEDDPQIGFNTNAYFVYDQEISGPKIDFRFKDVFFTCTLDYHFITIRDLNKSFCLGYDSNGKFRCEGNIDGKNITNTTEIVNIFKQVCPEAFEKVRVACSAYENSMKEPEEQKVENQDKMDENTGSIQQGAENAEELLEELNASDQVETINIDGNPGMNSDINVVETEPQMSIDEELFMLEQDPNVQRYIELMKLQADRNAMNQGPEMNI